MVTIRYKELKSGKYSTYLDIYTVDDNNNTKRNYEFLKIYVSKDYSKIKNVSQVDKDKVELVKNICYKREIEITGDVHGIRTGQKTTNISVIEFIKRHQFKTGDAHMKSLLYHLNGFTGDNDILFTDVSVQWLERFKDYLMSKMKQNTAKDYLKMLKARFNDAYRHEIITINPFKKFDVPKELEVERTTLDVEEVKALINTPIADKYIQLKQAFLFSCFTGLRLSDIETLKHNYITKEKGADGNTCRMLRIKPIKTQTTSGKTMKVPLSESAINIIDQVEKHNRNDKLFYKLPSRRNALNILKLWGAKAGITKNLHFHVGRHTFATISLTYGIDVYTVSKLLGHSEIRHTEIYAKIVDEKKRKEVKKLPVLE